VRKVKTVFDVMSNRREKRVSVCECVTGTLLHKNKVRNAVNGLCFVTEREGVKISDSGCRGEGGITDGMHIISKKNV
jgi:hypothetical protein